MLKSAASDGGLLGFPYNASKPMAGPRFPQIQRHSLPAKSNEKKKIVNSRPSRSIDTSLSFLVLWTLSRLRLIALPLRSLISQKSFTLMVGVECPTCEPVSSGFYECFFFCHLLLEIFFFNSRSQGRDKKQIGKEKNQKCGRRRWLIFSCHFSHLPLFLPPTDLGTNTSQKKMSNISTTTRSRSFFQINSTRFIYFAHFTPDFNVVPGSVEWDFISRWRRRDQLVLAWSSKNTATVVYAIGKNPGYRVQQRPLNWKSSAIHLYNYHATISWTGLSARYPIQLSKTVPYPVTIYIFDSTQKLQKLVRFISVKQYVENVTN